jgi:hypothetical protein
MTGQTVYRTADPAVIAAYRAAQDALTAYRQEIGDVLERHDVGHLTRMGTTGHGAGRFAGLAPDPDGDVPAGWRTGKTGYLIPDSRTRHGKAVRDALGSLAYPGDPRDALPGMPSQMLVPGRFLTCGVHLFGDVLYVTWSADEKALGDSADLTVWCLTKLSEYYAAVEQAGAAETAGAS